MSATVFFYLLFIFCKVNPAGWIQTCALSKEPWGIWDLAVTDINRELADRERRLKPSPV